MVQALRALVDQPSVAQGLLQTSSIEVSGHDAQVAKRLCQWFAPGTDVFVNFLPGTDFRRIVDVAAALRREGYSPVPHIAVRNFANPSDLDEAMAQLVGEAAVTKVLCIAGDLAVPRGPFPSTLGAIESGVLQRRGIVSVGFAGYPEGHHTLLPEAVRHALAAKLHAIRTAGHLPFIVTQFCFEAGPIIEWIEQIHRDGINVPVRIGIAGPASIRTLLTFAMRCGVGNSLRMLLNQPQSIGRLLRDASPDPLLQDLAEAIAAAPWGRELGVHLFPFGGVAKTGEWRRRALGN